MFINTKKSVKIKADNGTIFEARPGWIGEIPKWVEEHWYFKALCKDGSVTAIVSTKDKDIDPVDTELAELRARAAELKIPRANALKKENLKSAILGNEKKYTFRSAEVARRRKTLIDIWKKFSVASI